MDVGREGTSPGTSSSRNIPSGEERGETAVLAGYRNIEFISKQACRFFVPTLMSLQLQFRVHPCILIKLCCPRRKVCMILAFPPHPFSSFPQYRVSPAGMARDLPCQSSPIITIIPPIYNNNQIIIIKAAGLKAETEGFMIAAQGQSLPTRWYRHNILKKTDVDPNATLGTRGFSRVWREFSRGSL